MVTDLAELPKMCTVKQQIGGDGPANAANRVLPRLTLVATGTKFGTNEL